MVWPKRKRGVYRDGHDLETLAYNTCQAVFHYHILDADKPEGDWFIMILQRLHPLIERLIAGGMPQDDVIMCVWRTCLQYQNSTETPFTTAFDEAIRGYCQAHKLNYASITKRGLHEEKLTAKAYTSNGFGSWLERNYTARPEELAIDAYSRHTKTCKANNKEFDDVPRQPE